MKKIFLSVVLMLALSRIAAAQSVALVYENDAAVRAGQSVPGAVTPDGVVISAKWALTSNSTMLVGIPGDPLKKAVLLRLDTKSDTALIQPGDLVLDEALQKSYQEKAQSVLSFLPSVSSVAAPSAIVSSSVESSTNPFKIRVNGQDVGVEPIPLKVRFRKSEATFEIVRLSTTSVWFVDVEMKAEPKLSFWLKGRNQSLSDVPTPTFKYSQQIFFRPLADGRSIKIPVELYFMNEGPYEINVTINSKSERSVIKVPVIFKSKLK